MYIFQTKEQKSNGLYQVCTKKYRYGPFYNKKVTICIFFVQKSKYLSPF